jgi:lipoate-protein ligase A
MNLAIDEALIRSRTAGEAPPTLRLWRNPPCVVIGISQNPFAEVDLAACDEMGLPVVRRQSGGGAVYHDAGNLNYSLVVDLEALAGNTSTEQSYAFLLQGVIGALARFHLEATLRNISDVYVGERKIAGCAQYRTSTVVLHHGCLLVEADLGVLERTLRVPAAWYREVVNLVDLVTPRPGLEEATAAIAAAYAELFGVAVTPGELTPQEWSRAEQLYEEKYRRSEWNRRVPPGWRPGRYGPDRRR